MTANKIHDNISFSFPRLTVSGYSVLQAQELSNGFLWHA